MASKAREESKPVILVADDDLELVRMLATQLVKAGYRVLEAFKGDEAYTIALKDQPDLIILDVMMPVLNGWQVCKHLREKKEFERTGIIMLTGIGPNLNEMTASLYGADDHVDKPFVFDELQAKIKAVLAKRSGT